MPGAILRIVVTGAAGRLGAALSGELERRGHDVIRLRRRELDVTCTDRVKTVIRALRPDVIVNCCAYNAVDAAESNPSLAFAVNAGAPAALADAARLSGARLVHYSSDFVFDGAASEAYPEEARTNPLSVYGASKLAGEEAVRKLPEHYVLRVESLFGGCDGAQRATVDYIAGRLTSGLPVRAIHDRSVTPSYVTDVVRATVTMLEEDIPFGTYHCVASGVTTWHDLAYEIADQLKVRPDIVAVNAAEFPTVAARPRFCALSNAKLKSAGIDMPDWRNALTRHLRARSALAAVPPLTARSA